jgi:toxin ParE1/3/4
MWGYEQSVIYASAITQTFAVLRDHPRLGRQRDDLFSGCRSVQVEQHVIYYHQPLAAVIQVLRVLHHRQDARTEVEESYPWADPEP